MKLAPAAPHGWMTLADFADLLGVTSKHAGRIIQKEHLDHKRQGKWLYIHQDQAMALQRQRDDAAAVPPPSRPKQLTPAQVTVITRKAPTTCTCHECAERGFFFLSNGKLYCYRCFLEHNWRGRSRVQVEVKYYGYRYKQIEVR